MTLEDVERKDIFFVMKEKKKGTLNAMIKRGK